MSELKNIISELESKRGRHTELVSLYVPAGHDLNEIMNLVKQEQALTMNVKSKAVRKNVIGALEKIVQQLRLYRKTPETGLAIFCGNVSEKEGQTDLRIWAIEPPEPIRQKLYWCDQKFNLDHLRDLIKEKEVYLLALVDRSEADIAFLKGKGIRMSKHLDSIVPGKTTKGGWSQARYQRIREGLLKDFFKEVAGSIIALNSKDVKGIIMGGPGPTKEEFAKTGYLGAEAEAKLLAVKDISTMGENGLEELLAASEDVLQEASVMKEKESCSKFFSLLAKDSKLASYGRLEVSEKLKIGAVETLLISEDLPKETAEILKQNSEMTGAETIMVSTDTREGKQLFELGGVAAILRY